MRKLCLLACLVFCLVQPVSASELQEELYERYGAGELSDSLPEDAAALLEDVEPDEPADLLGEGTNILQKSVAQSGSFLKQSIRLMMRLLLVAVLCQVVEAVSGESGNRITSAAGTLAVTALCIVDVKTMIGLGASTMAQLSDFSAVLLPVMASTAAASGAISGAGASYAIAVFLSNILVRVSNGVIIPALYALIGLAVADAAIRQERLKQLREFLSVLIKNGMKAIVYLYVGLLSVTGVLSGSTDAATLKAAKTTISTMVPVVGSIISGAAETVLSGAALLRNAVGTFGMLAVLAMFLTPFLRIGINYLILKVSSALCGVLGSKLTGMLDTVSTVTGLLLGMIGSCALMTLLSCCCFLKVVQL